MLTHPDGSDPPSVEYDFIYDRSKVFIINIESLEVCQINNIHFVKLVSKDGCNYFQEGSYSFQLTLKNAVNVIEYVYVTIKSKAKEGETLAFTTNCWFSTADGKKER